MGTGLEAGRAFQAGPAAAAWFSQPKALELTQGKLFSKGLNLVQGLWTLCHSLNSLSSKQVQSKVNSWRPTCPVLQEVDPHMRKARQHVGGPGPGGCLPQAKLGNCACPEAWPGWKGCRCGPHGPVAAGRSDRVQTGQP